MVIVFSVFDNLNVLADTFGPLIGEIGRKNLNSVQIYICADCHQNASKTERIQIVAGKAVFFEDSAVEKLLVKQGGETRD